MKISTEIYSTERIVGAERAIELIAKAGFDCWDLSLFDMARISWSTYCIKETDHPLRSSNYASYVKNLRRIGEDCGITCNQSHAPFPSSAEGMMYYLKRAIECTAIAGGKICVIHPDNNKGAEENAEMYFELLPTAKEYGVKIATENMWNRNKETKAIIPAACSHHDDFVKHLKAVNDPYLVACLDIGHAEMGGLNTSTREMVLALGDSLQALHIHDNDLIDDTHEIPFSMKIDFNEMVKALAEIGYTGEFTLEADTYLKKFTEDNVFLGVKDLALTARKLANKFERLCAK